MRMARRTKKQIEEDRVYAQSLNLEWLKLSNKVLRAFPNSPYQLELRRQLATIPQYKA